MNIQDERIQSACDQLTLKAVAEQYAQLAQEAVRDDHSYSDYLEQCLKAEQDARRLRSQTMPLRFLQLHDQVGRGDEAYFDAALGGEVAQGYRQMGFTDATRSQQDDVLLAFDKSQ